MGVKQTQIFLGNSHEPIDPGAQKQITVTPATLYPFCGKGFKTAPGIDYMAFEVCSFWIGSTILIGEAVAEYLFAWYGGARAVHQVHGHVAPITLTVKNVSKESKPFAVYLNLLVYEPDEPNKAPPTSAPEEQIKEAMALLEPEIKGVMNLTEPTDTLRGMILALIANRQWERNNTDHVIRYLREAEAEVADLKKQLEGKPKCDGCDGPFPPHAHLCNDCMVRFAPKGYRGWLLRKFARLVGRAGAVCKSCKTPFYLSSPLGYWSI